MQVGCYHIQNLYVNQHLGNLYVDVKSKHIVSFFSAVYRGINHTVISV